MGKEYFIITDGKKVVVSEAVYRAFKRPLWVEHKRRKVRTDHERSLDAFMNNGFDIPSGDLWVDEIIEDKLMLDMLFAALADLTDNERRLIEALFFDEKSEREVAQEKNVTQNTINYHKNRVLGKLRKLLENKT